MVNALPHSQSNNPPLFYHVTDIHQAFHVGMGLSVQFLERKEQITLPAAGSEWYQTCQNWANYKAGTTDVWPQDDSGLKKRWPPLIEERSVSELE
jgi:hypothetical protein